MQLKHQPTEMLKQTPHIVAFIDFLGVTEKIKSSEWSSDFLQRMHYIYTSNIDTMEEVYKNYNKPRLKIKIFSDNIIMAHEIKTEKITFEDYLYVARWATIFQTHSLIHEAPVRGAITFGNFYFDDIFVYGDALVKAYEMESQRAVYPRIIVDNAFFHDMQFSVKAREIKEKIFQRDTDGEWFINFVEPINNTPDTDIGRAFITKLRHSIITLFEQYKSNAKLKQKYYWLVHKFNYLCDVSKFGNHKIILNHNNEPDIFAIYNDIAEEKYD